MILNDNPGKFTAYPIIILSYIKDDKMPLDLIIQPIISITDKRTLITFLIGGFVFIYNIDKDYKDLDKIIDQAISPENKLTIMHFPKGEAWDFILKFCNIK